MNKPQIIYKLFRQSIFETEAKKEYQRVRTDQLVGLAYILFFLELERRDKEERKNKSVSFSGDFTVKDRIKDFPFFELTQLLSYIKLEITGINELDIYMEENDLYGNDYTHVLDNIESDDHSIFSLFQFTIEELMHRKFSHVKDKELFEQKVLSQIMSTSKIFTEGVDHALLISENYLSDHLHSSIQFRKLVTKDQLFGELVFMYSFLSNEHHDLKKEKSDIFKTEEEELEDAIISIYPPKVDDENAIAVSLANERVQHKISSENTHWYLVDIVLRLLKNEGRAVVAVHSSFLEKQELKSYREYFLSFISELEIYDLGDEILNGLDTLLLFKKGKQDIPNVQFSAKTTDYGLQSIIVSNNELKENQFNLSPRRYLLKADDTEETYITLGDVLTVLNASGTSDYPSKFIELTSDDLSESFLNYEIEADQLREKFWVENEGTIDQSCFICHLKHLKNQQLQYGWVTHQEGVGIIADTGLTYFQVDENKIYVPYLINELHSDYFLEQLKAYANGNVIKEITIDDFLKIKIPLISIHDQKLKVVGFREAYVHSKAKEIGLEKANLALKEDFYKEYRSLRHNIGHLLSTIQSSIEVIGNVLENGNYDIDLATVINKKRQVTFGDQVNKVKKSSGDIYNWLKSFEDQLRQDYPLEKVPIPEVISFLERRFKDRKEFTFEYEKPKKDIDINIYLNKDAFVKVVDNVVQNAIHHGFVDRTKSYALKAEFNLIQNQEGTNLCLEISNNGEPFPDDFDFNALIERGQTSKRNSNTGLGGNDIYRTMKAMKGEFDLYLDRNSEYSVCYKLFFSCDVRNKGTIS
ncbi:hypothetical protein [Flammeovirga sp. SubArs3]|uniref:hypothetical protein n=1 Tax=Flammeovirga sp. SubArs3 TaxID=2995316 RepID=UPI00248CD6A0|nr:hypothetical protein [Flammeovirga sp. SubArs3]